jgi:hypothetical protein
MPSAPTGLPHGSSWMSSKCRGCGWGGERGGLRVTAQITARPRDPTHLRAGPLPSTSPSFRSSPSQASNSTRRIERLTSPRLDLPGDLRCEPKAGRGRVLAGVDPAAPVVGDEALDGVGREAGGWCAVGEGPPGTIQEAETPVTKDLRRGTPPRGRRGDADGRGRPDSRAGSRPRPPSERCDGPR